MYEYKVKIYKRTGRKNYEAKWQDPVTGKMESCTTGCRLKRDAERFAGKLAAELTEGRRKRTINVTWEDFRELYEAAKDWQSDNTFRNWLFTAAQIEKFLKPKLLSSINTAAVDRLKSDMLESGAAIASVKGRMKYLRAALNWAKRRGMIHETPVFELPEGGDEARCRPVTAEEFERMLSKIETRRKTAADFDFYLRGLWWSGLRLEESLKLSWDATADFAVDMSGKYPMLRIRQGAQKSKKAELLPLAPEFCEMLHSVPESEREGFVFAIPCQNGKAKRMLPHGVTRAVKRLAEAAKVKVSDGDSKVKWASPHDFRRAFCSRWSRRVMPAVLMRLARHSSIDTTMKYYAQQDAESVADAAFAAFAGDNSGDTSQNAVTEPLENQSITTTGRSQIVNGLC